MNSRFETFSLICAEAMACGKPVLATACGGPQEFVTPETGILIPVDSPSELKHAIIKMCLEYNKYESKKLQDYIRLKLSPERVGKIFYSIYQTILG